MNARMGVRCRAGLLALAVVACGCGAVASSRALAVDGAGGVSVGRQLSKIAIAPARIRPLVPGQPNDGIWWRADRWAGTPAPILLTRFHFDRSDTREVAYVAWMRASRTQPALYPGLYGPGPTTLPRGPEQVPLAARSRLLATFNSGFYEQDAAGGFYVNGLLYDPMLRGLATVVAYRDGRVDVIRWQAGRRPGRGIVMARQNLPLFVNNGRVNPILASSTLWGDAPFVWRTGLGIDRRGNLVYVAAPNLAAVGLARLLVHAGVVRAMELDINLTWPILVTYAGPGASKPSLFVPNPTQIPGRFLSISTKDFFALYLRTAASNPNEPY
jgi:Phosphodiester glycosidase